MTEIDLTPLMAAASTKDLAGVKKALERNRHIDAADAAGRTALMHAVIGSFVDGVNLILQHGANANIRDRNGWSALHFAAQQNSASTVSALVGGGADVNAADDQGNTPLFRAVFSFRDGPTAIPTLLAAGAAPDLTNHHGVSPRALAHSISNYSARKFFAERT